jgi:hypothetical protein
VDSLKYFMGIDPEIKRKYLRIGALEDDYIEYLEGVRVSLMRQNGTPGFNLTPGEIYWLKEGYDNAISQGICVSEDLEAYVRGNYERLKWNFGSKVGPGEDGFVRDGVVHMIFSRAGVPEHYGD